MDLHNLKKPKKLQPGDKVTAVTLSWGGPGTFPWKFDHGVKQLEALLDVEFVPMEHTYKPAEWISANPKARADDLMAAFSDNDIKAIFSPIGGSDSIRTLPYLDLEIMRRNPKIFMGYSDSTITHFACIKAGLSSFYGPSVMSGFGENGGLHDYLADWVKSFLTGQINSPRLWRENPSGWVVEQLPWEDESNLNKVRPLLAPTKPKFLQGQKKVEGRLIGGCLEVLEFLKGTQYWPIKADWRGAIFFLETSEEAPSPEFLKRCLRNYAEQGIFEEVKAVLFGRPGGKVPVKDFKQYDEALIEVISKEYGFLDLPIVSMLDFGHTDPMAVLPYGLRMEIDPENQEISFLEEAVV